MRRLGYHAQHDRLPPYSHEAHPERIAARRSGNPPRHASQAKSTKPKKSIQLKVQLAPPKWDVLFSALARSLLMRRPGAAPKENLPNGPRSGSCPGFSSHDHRSGTSRHALRQRGKRYLITRPRPSRRPGYVVVSPHPGASFDASLAWPSTSAQFNPIGSCPARNQLSGTSTEVPYAPDATHSHPHQRAKQKSSPKTNKGRTLPDAAFRFVACRPSCRPSCLSFLPVRTVCPSCLSFLPVRLVCPTCLSSRRDLLLYLLLPLPSLLGNPRLQPWASQASKR